MFLYEKCIIQEFFFILSVNCGNDFRGERRNYRFEKVLLGPQPALLSFWKPLASTMLPLLPKSISILWKLPVTIWNTIGDIWISLTWKQSVRKDLEMISTWKNFTAGFWTSDLYSFRFWKNTWNKRITGKLSSARLPESLISLSGMVEIMLRLSFSHLNVRAESASIWINSLI